MSGRVAVVRTSPETVHDDIERLCALGGMSDALQAGATTIVKDNISWHLPYLSANTTPWQLEGTIDALKGAGFDELVAHAAYSRPLVAGTSLRIVLPMVDFPLPLSPTSPTVVPASIVKLTSSTAFTSSMCLRNTPPVTGNQVRRFLTSSRGTALF